MAYNKFITKDGTVMLDLTDTTVSSTTLGKDIIAIDKYGNKITGTLTDSPLPVEVSTEEEMTALLESGEVGGVYKYVGETTEVYENGTMYVLEVLPDALAGTWVFNDLSMVYANGLTEGTGWLVNFVMDEVPTLTFMALEITDASSTSDKLFTLTGYTTNGRTGPLIAYHGGGYHWEAGISMTITSTLSEVENGDTLLAWLQINATKQ